MISIASSCLALLDDSPVIWEKPESSLVLKAATGAQARVFLPQISALNLVWKEWPYCWEGGPDDDSAYFERYFSSTASMFLFLIHAEEIVGYAAVIPLESEVEDIQKPFKAQFLNLSKYFYLGAIVIKKEFRHQKGLFAALYDYGTSHTQRFARKYIALAMIERDPCDARCPEGYVSPDGICEKFGFVRHDDMIVQTTWKDSTTHTFEPVKMPIWIKEIATSTSSK